MKVSNMRSTSGNDVPNQFIIEDDRGIWFQSYQSMIALIPASSGIVHPTIFLDEYYWNYSRTTSKYRNQFLGETTKETQAKIDSGEYKLVNLNK